LAGRPSDESVCGFGRKRLTNGAKKRTMTR
jgi:hypothetical protein